ncbi:hypothetical protein J4401_07515 [Candidatus Woesearchaeota archaeon]|nr:hypothetical protein [Candidatus Woesearchaeota archaeon]
MTKKEHPEEKKVSLRSAVSWAVGSVAVGIVIGAATSNWDQRKDNQEVIVRNEFVSLEGLSYSGFYQRVAETPKVTFEHPNHTTNIPGDIKQTLENVILQKAPPDTEILGKEYSAKTHFVSIGWGHKLFQEYVRRSNNSIKEFFEYAGIENLVPNVSYSTIGAEYPLRESNTNTAGFNICWNSTNRYGGKFRLKTSGKNTSGKEEGYAGAIYSAKAPDANAELGIDVQNENGPVLKELIYGPFVFALGFNAVSSYTSPPMEAMHFALHELRAKYSIAEMNDKFNKTGVVTSDIINDSVIKWFLRETAVIRGMIDNFIIENAPGIGLDMGEVAAYTSRSSRNFEEDKLVPEVREMIRQIGPKEVMRLYLNDPEKLFSKQ